MKTLCVFCGSSPGTDPAMVANAHRLGRMLGEQGIGLVFGGGRVGLMGTVATAVLQAGGQVTGVIPQHLYEREVAYNGLINLEIVGSMHERKARMVELSDGFIALPGGLGTFEEILETLTWAQLGLHQKPCGLLNVAGYYDLMAAFLNHAVQQGFLAAPHKEMLIVEQEPDQLLERFRVYRPPQADKAQIARHNSATHG
jgi:uncharacterized protein (TIGR00730 family)